MIIRRGKGAKDRVTVIAERALSPLRENLRVVRALYGRDLAAGSGWEEVPGGLDVK